MSRNVVLILFFGAACAQAVPMKVQKHFEFENAKPENQWLWYRSEASGGRTLRMVDQKGTSSIKLTLCIEPSDTTQNVTVFIDDIRYSNDGQSDVVALRYVNLRQEICQVALLKLGGRIKQLT
ncbi:hypothetical protein DPMN_181457 [Dreissena polymorpha]|uniref:Uncharacterized protein n=1 Tax=Dreissena polymorpha TaxID=45954 RepID=A0A9D4DDU5_DREPO|nr:hypothetical protein DPMN_181457 [Dreissena polymorpha]